MEQRNGRRRPKEYKRKVFELSHGSSDDCLFSVVVIYIDKNIMIASRL